MENKGFFQKALLAKVRQEQILCHRWAFNPLNAKALAV